MQRNNDNTHSNSVSAANKAGFLFIRQNFFSPHSISVYLQEDYEVIIILFLNQTLKVSAIEGM